MPKAAKKGTKPGRPPRRAGEKLSKNRTFRIRGNLDARLQEAASVSGRSVSEEIEYQLELAVSHRDYLKSSWGEDVYNIALSAARSLASIETFTGKRWVEDERTYSLFQRTLAQLAQNYRDLVLRNARERPNVRRPFEPGNEEHLPEYFADIGGISPPYPRDDTPERIFAHKKASLDEFRKRIQVSRPLPIEDEKS